MIKIEILEDADGWYWTSDDGVYPLWVDAERYPTDRVCGWAVEDHFLNEEWEILGGMQIEPRPPSTRMRNPLRPGPKPTSTCKAGHPYVGYYTNGRPICRVCASARGRRWRESRRQAQGVG